MEQFFSNIWNPFIYKFRKVVILIFVVMFALAMNEARNIGPLTKQEDFVPRTNELVLPWTIQYDIFNGVEESGKYTNNMLIEIVFGIKNLNQEDNGMWEPE